MSVSLTDAQWARIEPTAAESETEAGWAVAGHRQATDAIAFKYRTGTPWMDLPEHFGSWSARRRGPSKGAPAREPADHAVDRPRGGRPRG
ncbi:transposase [Streptomyces endophytica]|uniref:transposase n=1 Tax=Streptomyces endophytica TaxID=2991496 RepID=UPI003C6FFE33